MEDSNAGISSGDMEAGMDMGFSPGELETARQKEDYSGEGKLPFRYDKTLIRLVSRDPSTLYAYWEVNQDIYYHSKPLLRIFCEEKRSYFDIEINYNTIDWYINGVEPGKTYRASIGYIRNGKFHELASSRTVSTPPGSPSDIIDERWMTIEELSRYTYLIDINNTLSLMKSLEKRRERERNVDSFMLQQD
ncbi:MAG: DUF4912 domain-containing protein [Halanaerobiaceae bacterium]